MIELLGLMDPASSQMGTICILIIQKNPHLLLQLDRAVRKAKTLEGFVWNASIIGKSAFRLSKAFLTMVGKKNLVLSEPYNFRSS